MYNLSIALGPFHPIPGLSFQMHDRGDKDDRTGFAIDDGVRESMNEQSPIWRADHPAYVGVQTDKSNRRLDSRQELLAEPGAAILIKRHRKTQLIPRLGMKDYLPHPNSRRIPLKTFAAGISFTRPAIQSS